jgi:geranylgeranyl pyrophosphate synthase
VVSATYPDHLREEVDAYLETITFSHSAELSGLVEAMRYSLLAPGKRIRPVLCLATAARNRAALRERAAAGGGARADPHLFADP